LPFPNPVSDRLFFKGGRPVQKAELIDLLGRTIKSWSGDLSSGLDVSQLLSGIYWVKVYFSCEETETHKIGIGR